MINSIFSLEAIEKIEEGEMNKYTVGMILGLIGAGLNFEAQANQVLEQAPFIYTYNLPGPFSLESEIITTAGTIKSISASAEFSGEVRLEVSANGGLDYTRIINGVPLAAGFIPGNQLRFKANIAAESILKKITLGYADSSGALRLLHNPELAGFKKHKSFSISGANKELFNYPLKFKTADGVSSEGIYFTAADGQTPLAYYQESKDVVWVKLPEIPKEGTRIEFYSGNKEAKDTSRPTEVFTFFDDFNAPVLDVGKWQLRQELKGKYSLQDGYLKLTGCAVIARDFRMKAGILEFKAKVEKNAAIQAIVHGALAANLTYPSEEMVYSSAYPGAEHTIAINDVVKLNVGNAITPLTDYIYRAVLNDAGIIFERYGQDYIKQAEIRFLESYRNEAGYIGLKADGALLDGGSVYFDWVRVRPYTEVEPQIVGEQ